MSLRPEAMSAGSFFFPSYLLLPVRAYNGGKSGLAQIRAVCLANPPRVSADELPFHCRPYGQDSGTLPTLWLRDC